MKKVLFVLLFPFMCMAEVAPENILTKSCLESYQNTYKTLKDHKAFIYARESDTGKDRCNWAYGYDTKKEAIDSAMKGCQSYVLNAECIVVDRDGVFEVKEDVFSKITPADETPLTKEKIDAFLRDAKSLILGNCYPYYKKFLEAKEHKSFGYSVDTDGKYACGYSYQNQTDKRSKKRAVEACEKNKLKRGSKTPKSPCKVYATNKQVLLKASDYGINLTADKERYLSTSEYKTLLDKAKEIIDEGACLLQFKYYLRSKEHQAFYFTQSKDGKQACGRKDDTFSMDVAQKKAKERCEAMAKKKGIKWDCKLFAQNFEIVSKSSNFGLEDGIEDFKLAIYYSNMEKVKKYIAKGYDVNTQTKKDGITSLFVAAAKNDKDFFFELIKKSADIQHKAKDSSTLLHAAVLGRNIEIVEYLLDKGLDINAKGYGGMTPLHTAIGMLDTDMMKLLIEKGAKTDIKNDKGKTASELFKGIKLDLEAYKPKESKTKEKDTKIDKTNSQPIEEVLQITVKTMNKDLPKMIDKEIRFDRTSAKDKKMVFHYTLMHFTNWTMPLKKLRSLTYEDTKSEVCEDKDSQQLLQKGVVLEYSYKGKNKNHIGTYTFDAKSCGLKTNTEKVKRLLQNIKNMQKK